MKEVMMVKSVKFLKRFGVAMARDLLEASPPERFPELRQLVESWDILHKFKSIEEAQRSTKYLPVSVTHLGFSRTVQLNEKRDDVSNAVSVERVAQALVDWGYA